MSKKLTLDEWNQRVITMNPHARILSKHVENQEDVYSIHCNDCNATYDVTLNNLKVAYSHRMRNVSTNKYCPICSGHRCVMGINDIYTVRKDLIKYFVNIDDAKTYSIGSGQKVLLRCPVCEKIRMFSILQLAQRGFTCEYCEDSISIPNKMLRTLMSKLSVQDLKFEYVSDWTYGKKYDCYFVHNSKNYLIEIDGEQHIRDTEWSTRKVQQENDKLKSRLANENNFKLIRIPAYSSNLDNIKENILKSELSTMFDLNNLDWDEIYKGTASNLNVEICNYYNEHKKDMMMRDIAKNFNICSRTLTLILQKMTKLGFCQYSQTESFSNRGKHICNSKMMKKRRGYESI